MCFVKRSLLNNSTEQIVIQNPESTEILRILSDIWNTRNLKNAPYLINYLDLECEESAGTSEIEAKLMTSPRGEASVNFISRSGFLDHSVSVTDDKPLDVVL